jgi:hypothetical protein
MGKVILKEIREWGFFILAIATLIIGLMTFSLYLQTSPKTKPDLEVELLDQTNLEIADVANIWHMSNGTFGIQKSYLNFKITNLGLKDTGRINIRGIDPEEEYRFNSLSIENLESLNTTYFQLPFFSKECSEANYDALSEDQSYRVAYDICKESRNNLTLGTKNLFVKFHCPGCEFGKRYQCYLFEICFSELDEPSCGEDPNYYNLKEVDCPED